MRLIKKKFDRDISILKDFPIQRSKDGRMKQMSEKKRGKTREGKERNVIFPCTNTIKRNISQINTRVLDRTAFL